MVTCFIAAHRVLVIALLAVTLIAGAALVHASRHHPRHGNEHVGHDAEDIHNRARDIAENRRRHNERNARHNQHAHDFPLDIERVIPSVHSWKKSKSHAENDLEIEQEASRSRVPEAALPDDA